MDRIKVIIFVLFVIGIFFFLNSPIDFPVGTIFHVEEGLSLRSVSLQLKKTGVIRSRTVFEAFVIILGKERRIMSADYYFENNLPVYEVARRIVKGEHNMAPITLTIPEGFDVSQIADTASFVLPNFNKNLFLEVAKSFEGYLFPDTYFFFSTDTEKDVLQSMKNNFNSKIKSILPEITKMGKTEKEIIILASLVEREAKGDADREFISGILWKRLSLGMPLQVDAEPSTYKTKGLPANPIANPGLESINAALYPRSSPYLYYLHDKEGGIHFAKSFEEHRRNVLKYLKK